MDKFRGFQACMLDRFHISDRCGDLAGAQCGNGGNGDGDDADVQGVVPMECDNDLLPEWEDCNGRHWTDYWMRVELGTILMKFAFEISVQLWSPL